MIAWDMLRELTLKLPPELVKKVNESELYVIVGNNSKICIKGADDPDSLRGVGLNGVVLDEYADMKPRVFTEVIKPSLADKGGWCYFIGTPKGYNHFFDLWNTKKNEPGWACFRYTTYDNPRIAKEEIEEARKLLPEDTFAQEYLAEFRKFEGLVYKEFQREVHVKELPADKQWMEVIAGVDFGYTNPAAIVVIGKDFDNHFWVLEELYKTGLTNTEIIERCKNLREKHRINAFYPDHAEPDRIEEMTRAGLSCREVNKDIVKGIDKVRELFKAGRLKITPGCENLIWELEAYHYPPKKDNHNAQEEPIKEDDHCLDALRYALFTSEPERARGGAEFSLYGATYR